MASQPPAGSPSSLLDVGLYLTMNGYNWYWVAFGCMITSLLATVGLDLMRPRGLRLFHQIAIVVLTTASLAYFSMALDLSTSGPEAQIGGGAAVGPLSYVWYIMWTINLPLLLLSVLLVTGLSLAEILSTLFAAVVLVLSGLVADAVPAHARAFSLLSGAALAYVIFSLLCKGARSAYAAGDAFGTRYLLSAALLALLLLGYPAAYALAHGVGARALEPAAAAGVYGVLDVLAQPVFLFFFLYQLSQIDPGSVCGAIALGEDEEAQLARASPRRLRRCRAVVVLTY
ncbi:family A G protein-coupled receptor-like protein [Phanerochaete sordida]|uniref:Family A G protein-coupled receptor-like protein n=1 Tax=Phanerochaete sordida TaxID=48140 RepID=A0A9P3GTZ4_9APHY|nr:family A G protein-coupled receptor-like protein [Phanerochaete sordida]